LEQHWLKLRPIQEYRVSSVYETPDGIMGFYLHYPNEGEPYANRINEVLCDRNSLRSEKNEALGAGKYFAEAVAAKTEVWCRYLTAVPRPGDNTFSQQLPPYYSPASIIDPLVQQVTPGHVLITYGEPIPPDTCGGMGRLRWHLRLEEGNWRIERHENVDDPTKPRKLGLP